tara:strand:- start:1918 stop:3024 length:1107 start_codon:yes stop_codon:yes gene_type:complete
MFNFKSISNYKLFLKANKLFKNIVFYSEGQEYDHFYLPYVNACLDENIPFSYVSSEEKKPFKNNDLSKFFYIGKSFVRTLFFSSLECENLITTTPDLENFYLKKSSKCKNYIYFFHSMCSVNVIYNNNAFSHYDTILCANKFHTKEFQSYYFSNKNRKLIDIGYPKIDELIVNSNSEKTTEKIESILIAPTWGDEKESFKIYIKIIKFLLKNNYNITFRPHPVSLLKFNKFINEIQKKFLEFSNFKISCKKDNLDDYLSNDMIISDWSGSAIEYSLSTKKPCIFLNTKQKIRNKESTDYEKNNSFENIFRSSVGKNIETENISEILNFINDKNYLNSYQKKIDLFREKYLHNFRNTDSAIKKFIKTIS